MAKAVGFDMVGHRMMAFFVLIAMFSLRYQGKFIVIGIKSVAAISNTRPSTKYPRDTFSRIGFAG